MNYSIFNDPVNRNEADLTIFSSKSPILTDTGDSKPLTDSWAFEMFTVVECLKFISKNILRKISVNCVLLQGINESQLNERNTKKLKSESIEKWKNKKLKWKKWEKWNEKEKYVNSNGK